MLLAARCASKASAARRARRLGPPCRLEDASPRRSGCCARSELNRGPPCRGLARRSFSSEVAPGTTQPKKLQKENSLPGSKVVVERLASWLDYREDSGFRGDFVSGRRRQDLEALVNNYTAPALARALRDREEILAECATLVCPDGKAPPSPLNEEELSSLHELLLPYAVLPQPVKAFNEASAAPPGSNEKGPANVGKRASAKIVDNESLLLSDYRTGGLFHPDVIQRLRKRLNRLPREISRRSHRRASVILPLCTVDGEPSILFTERSHNVNRHKGEVCFPGGMVDEVDASIVDAGLRELHEEVGIHPDIVDVLGVLRCDWTEVTSITGVAVTPIIGYLGAFEELELDPNPGEVRSYFTVPITTLIDKENWETRDFSPPIFRNRDKPGSPVIWGLTGYILHRFMRLLPSVVFGRKITRTDFSREISM